MCDPINQAPPVIKIFIVSRFSFKLNPDNYTIIAYGVLFHNCMLLSMDMLGQGPDFQDSVAIH